MKRLPNSDEHWTLYSDLAVWRPIARSLDCKTRSGGDLAVDRSGRRNSLKLMTSPNKQYQSGRDRASPDRHNLQSGCDRASPDRPDCFIRPCPIGLIARSTRLLYSPDRPDCFIHPIGPMALFARSARSLLEYSSPDRPDCVNRPTGPIDVARSPPDHYKAARVKSVITLYVDLGC